MAWNHPLSAENDERAARALDALLHYADLVDPGCSPDFTIAAGDLLTDLRHLADRATWEWHEALAQAELHYHAERRDQP